MKIEFRKISKSGEFFELKKDDLLFFGKVKKIDEKTFALDGELKGSILCECDRCAETFDLQYADKINIKVVDGILNEDCGDLDIVESFDGSVDLDTILSGEVESKRCDYHCCDKCKN